MIKLLRDGECIIVGLIISVAALITTILLNVFFNINLDPGVGQKTGQIVRVAEVGLLNKTWEAQLIRGGFTDGSGVIGQSFEFTFNGKQAEMLQECMLWGSEVRIEYQTKFISSRFSSGSGGNFLTAIGQISRGKAELTK